MSLMSHNNSTVVVTSHPRIRGEGSAGDNAGAEPTGEEVRQIGRAGQVTPQVLLRDPRRQERPLDGTHPLAGLPKSITDDNTTQVSSSSGSGKPPSLDGKSVTSATTFALDEKESLRPDDSASARAIEEEDVFSAPGSVVAGSRVGSDCGVKAFRDQLQEIPVMGPFTPRPAVVNRFQSPAVANGAAGFGTASPTGSVSVFGPRLANDSPQIVVPEIGQPAPDEKLLEALESPRDRLFVLKTEQDIIDFVNDSKNTSTDLPQCNAFYRMLTHRLADYYDLGHVLDDSLSAVRIFKQTTIARLPPPLSGISNPPTGANTPPNLQPARKIMRRGDGGKNASGVNTSTNSEGASKATSEAEGSDGGEGEGKSKAALTRQEREAKYNEARLRIFGNVEETKADGEIAAEEKDRDKDASRSSSASGKKKGKKQRGNNDDGFEARSQFVSYYGPSQAAAGYSEEDMYYGTYPAMMPPAQYPAMPSNASPPIAYNGTFPYMAQQGAQRQYCWPQNYTAGTPVIGGQSYSPPAQYDLSASFQTAMQSFQMVNTPPQGSAKMTMPSPPLANYPAFQPQSQPLQPSWAQPQYQNAYQLPQMQYPQMGYTDPSGMPTNQGQLQQQQQQQQHMYGQYPTSPYQNGKPPRNSQHPLPGSYNRQQFNPQSQAFVPGGRAGPAPMHGTIPIGSPSMSGYSNFPLQMSPQLPRQSPATPQLPSFSSNRATQSTNNGSAPKGTAGTAQPFSHPLPQPLAQKSPKPATSPATTGQSSIAKWGTPAHLPPKPPPPVSMQPPKGLPYPPMRMGNGVQAGGQTGTGFPANGLAMVNAMKGGGVVSGNGSK
ncbi:hypothetical protein W97_02092 [Coniosporium apollinis CBS 100218]|uniref:SUZ domain-containing protein n=1 Tax=Coniosporium apollinis (strain CBS 100218) TaxID=1168221 RepID=R7YLS1_CONA1|nr:uncharacterized protein W97_02092 [Coniosporium apollinis CBS 100218]EON62867.1 hypothetical protein W97_02092 [Coniosporium apollinis CBS 100218]